MAKLEPVTPVRDKRWIYVEVEHGGRIYFVHIRPNNKLGGDEVLWIANKLAPSRDLKSPELRKLLTERATKRLAGARLEALKPKPQPRFSLTERVERAAVLTLHEWRAEGRHPGRIDSELMYHLYSCMRRINDAIVDLRLEAEKTVHSLPPHYFQDIKRKELVKLREKHEITNKMRTFCSRVLSRAYAWKNGKIPPEELEIIEKHLPGFRLMLA